MVLDIKEKKHVAGFIENVHAAKVQIERKMRIELDCKIMAERERHVHAALGKNLVKRLRFYIKVLTAK